MMVLNFTGTGAWLKLGLEWSGMSGVYISVIRFVFPHRLHAFLGVVLKITKEVTYILVCMCVRC